MKNFLALLKVLLPFTSDLENRYFICRIGNFPKLVGRFLWWSSSSKKLQVAILLIKEYIAGSVWWIMRNFLDYFLVNAFALVGLIKAVTMWLSVSRYCLLLIKGRKGPHFSRRFAAFYLLLLLLIWKVGLSFIQVEHKSFCSK